MKIKLLAALVAATACGSNAFAAEVYNSEGTTLSIGGYVDVGVGEYDKSKDVSQTRKQSQDVDVNAVSPRINIAGSQDVGNGVIVDMKGEWALKYLDGGDTSFTTRLGYIGVTHEEMGRMVVGTQWSPYYDVGSVADYPIAFANDFLYENQNIMGGARAERMVSYRNSYAFSDDGMVNLGLGWQGDESEEGADSRVQAALSLKMMGFGLGYAYSGGEYEVSSVKQDAISHIFSLHYGSYGSGLFVAGVYAMNEYFFDDLEESVQLEGLLAYGMDNGLNVSVNYEAVDDDKNNKTQFSTSAIQLEYTVTPNLITFAGYEIDLGDDDATTEDDDKWLIGARYFL
ncbi:porin [Vibrio tetraodonis]|uniref:porin n=1 Tax=Vibrio tetraodonis TaxID=2231647 RepID=UPI000E0B35F2|nr:porin [Vibrio tetraodonis]